MLPLSLPLFLTAHCKITNPVLRHMKWRSKGSVSLLTHANDYNADLIEKEKKKAPVKGTLVSDQPSVFL